MLPRNRSRDPYMGTAERLEKRFMQLGLGIILVWILTMFVIIGAIIALLIYFL